MSTLESIAPGPKQVTDIDVRIGARVRAARDAAGLSQSVLAAGLGISFQQIQKYEKGRNRFSASALQRVADLLGVPVAQFFDPPGPVPVKPPQTAEQARAAHRAATEALEAAIRREAATQLAEAA
jgi:transcriptional regulator with XRE-family HTH domain